MDFMDRTIPSWVLRGCEWFFALLGAAVCVVVAIAFASQQFNDLWLTPGLYFLEIIFLALLVLISKVAEVKPVKMSNSVITWIAGGVLLAFVILCGIQHGAISAPSDVIFLAGSSCWRHEAELPNPTPFEISFGRGDHSGRFDRHIPAPLEYQHRLKLHFLSIDAQFVYSTSMKNRTH